MRICPYCHREHDRGTCPGRVDEVVAGEPDSMDQLIQRASVPSLASLFRKAKETGAIGPVSVYGEGSTT